MPVIDRARGLIFVHNPKAAGTSITNALGVKKDKAFGQHQPLHEIPKHQTLFSFGFIRNPWDRFVSLYSFYSQKPLRAVDLYNQEEVLNMGFKKWLLEWEYPPGISERRRRTIYFRRSQMWWLKGCRFIGRYEHLQDDFDHVCGQIGLPRRVLPHANASRHGHYREMYDDETRDAVAEWAAPEIAEFGYGF